MSKVKTYSVKSTYVGSDLILRTNKEHNATGYEYDETVNGTVDGLKNYVLGGLTPIEGGVLKITEINFGNESDTDISTIVNAMSPAYAVEQYETLFFRYLGQIFLFKIQDVTIGTGQTAVVNGDFIEFPISVGATGASGTNGTNGTNGATIRNGVGAPSNGLGANGDYYINTTNGDLYEKASGTYSIIFNIKGATGASGANGTNGTNGQGVPTGGTTEQILSKVDGTNYNTHWVNKPPTWIIGDIREMAVDATFLNANFSITGLGINLMVDWAIMNGNNGTPDHNGRVTVAYGADYLTLGAQAGDKDAVVVSHTHTYSKMSVTTVGDQTVPAGSTDYYTPASDNSGTTGVSGTDKNMQPYVVVLRIMKIA
jgi:hypothetical protein